MHRQEREALPPLRGRADAEGAIEGNPKYTFRQGIYRLGGVEEVTCNRIENAKIYD